MTTFISIQELKENLPIDIKIEWSDKQYSSSKYLLYDIQDRFILVKAMEQDEQFLIPIDEIECITILEEGIKELEQKISEQESYEQAIIRKIEAWPVETETE